MGLLFKGPAKPLAAFGIGFIAKEKNILFTIIEEFSDNQINVAVRKCKNRVRKPLQTSRCRAFEASQNFEIRKALGLRYLTSETAKRSADSKIKPSFIATRLRVRGLYERRVSVNQFRFFRGRRVSLFGTAHLHKSY